jgi:hypothetical protein
MKISKLTKEQESKIPEYIQKWVDLASQPIDRAKSLVLAKEIWQKEKPLIFFTESVENTLNLIIFILKENKIKASQLHSQLHSQLYSQLYSQLHSQLYSQLHSQLYSQLHSQLHSQLDSQLDSQLYSQLHSQLYSQLHSQLDSQLDSQLYSQLDSQLDSQLHSQLYSQLYSQLDSQLDSQLHSQLYSQLHSQLHSQLYSQLHSQLDSQLDSQLYSQLDSQLHSQLDSQLDSQLYSQLHNQKLIFSRYVFYHLYDWAGYYDYGKYIGVEFNNLQKYVDILLNMPICVFAGNLIFICEKPLCRWENGKLHSETQPAIGWKDNTGLYFLKGVKFDKELRKEIVEKTISIEKAIKLPNIEQRIIAMDYLGGEKLEKELGGIIKSKDQYGELIELTKLKDTQRKNYLYYKSIDSSKNSYVYLRVKPDCKTPQEAMTEAYKLGRFELVYEPINRT